MKKTNKKLTTKRSIVIIATVLTLALTATGALSLRIQVTLSPDVTVTLNGVKQDFMDANGNAVYPILYEGTTYLPVRAVAGLTGYDVKWDGETKTVYLSNIPSNYNAKLTDVGAPSYGVTVTTDMAAFPNHNFGFELTGFNRAYRVDSDMPLTGTYRTITFDFTMIQLAEADRFDPLKLCLINADTGALLWESYCGPGQIIEDVTVDIGGVTTMRWSFTGGAMQNQAVGYILNPYVS